MQCGDLTEDGPRERRYILSPSGNAERLDLWQRDGARQILDHTKLLLQRLNLRRQFVGDIKLRHLERDGEGALATTHTHGQKVRVGGPTFPQLRPLDDALLQFYRVRVGQQGDAALFFALL